MKVIGITGGVGSGKSELLRYMKDHYRCRIIMADEASHEVMRVGGRIHDELVQILLEIPGEEPLVDRDGEIIHSAMASRIFGSPKTLEKVNGLIHPAVKAYILGSIQEEQEREGRKDPGAVSYFFIEAALLIECGYRPLVDEMWYIYCNLAVRRQRLKASRGYSDAKIDSILKAQLSEEEFRKGSDYVIDNSGSLEEAFRQIDARLLSENVTAKENAE